jgi:hypothetical protein
MVRYSSPISTSSQTITSIHTHAGTAVQRQRLAKDAADWMPPVYLADVLSTPTFYRWVAPMTPVFLPAVSGQSLYNRPPPYSNS